MGVQAVSSVLALAIGAAVCFQGAFALGELDAHYFANEWTGDCALGETPEGRQSPINIEVNYPGEPVPPVPADLVSVIRLPKIKGAKVKNTGHSIQLEWDLQTAFDINDDDSFPLVAAGGNAIRDVLDDPSIKPDRMVKMVPVQMHWHVTAEHSWDGMLGAAEAHVVTLVAEGEAPEWGCDEFWGGGDPNLANCVAVFGVIFRLADAEVAGNQEFFDKLIDKVSPIINVEDLSELPDYETTKILDLQDLLPEDQSYYTYVGSLTTPPCTEGLRWHVLNQHIPMSRPTYSAMELLMANTAEAPGKEPQHYRHNNRDIQPANDRPVYFHDTGAAKLNGVAGSIYEYCTDGKAPLTAEGPGPMRRMHRA